MKKASQDLLAGAAFAGDQHRCLGRRHLRQPLEQRRHLRIGVDRCLGAASCRLEHGGNQLGIRRQRQEFLGAGGDGAQRRLLLLRAAAGDHRAGDALGRQRLDQPRDVEAQVAEDQIRSLAAGAGQPLGRAFHMHHRRSPRARHARGLHQLPFRRADDQQASHAARSDLTISVIVTPRRLSSTITTSPRATRRLLT